MTISDTSRHTSTRKNDGPTTISKLENAVTAVTNENPIKESSDISGTVYE